VINGKKTEGEKKTRKIWVKKRRDQHREGLSNQQQIGRDPSVNTGQAYRSARLPPTIPTHFNMAHVLCEQNKQTVGCMAELFKLRYLADNTNLNA
jgi:hypothetical protein